MALKNYKLDGAPTAKVKIEGKTYDVDLGNITFVVEANSWAKRLSSFTGLSLVRKLQRSLLARRIVSTSTA